MIFITVPHSLEARQMVWCIQEWYMLVYTWIQEMVPVRVQVALAVVLPSLVRVFIMSVLLWPMMWVHLNLYWICLTVSACGSCVVIHVAGLYAICIHLQGSYTCTFMPHVFARLTIQVPQYPFLLVCSNCWWGWCFQWVGSHPKVLLTYYYSYSYSYSFSPYWWSW